MKGKTNPKAKHESEGTKRQREDVRRGYRQHQRKESAKNSTTIDETRTKDPRAKQISQNNNKKERISANKKPCKLIN